MMWKEEYYYRNDNEINERITVMVKNKKEIYFQLIEENCFSFALQFATICSYFRIIEIIISK